MISDTDLLSCCPSLQHVFLRLRAPDDPTELLFHCITLLYVLCCAVVLLPPPERNLTSEDKNHPTLSSPSLWCDKSVTERWGKLSCELLVLRNPPLPSLLHHHHNDPFICAIPISLHLMCSSFVFWLQIAYLMHFLFSSMLFLISAWLPVYHTSSIRCVNLHWHHYLIILGWTFSQFVPLSFILKSP